MITLQTDQIRLDISAHGAEPRSLRDATGRELLWQAADPWNRSACILFPAICRHTDDVIRADGADSPGAAGASSAGPRMWPMPKHGLARDLDFDVVDVEDTRAVLALQSSAATMQSYP